MSYHALALLQEAGAEPASIDYDHTFAFAANVRCRLPICNCQRSQLQKRVTELAPL